MKSLQEIIDDLKAVHTGLDQDALTAGPLLWNSIADLQEWKDNVLGVVQVVSPE